MSQSANERLLRTQKWLKHAFGALAVLGALPILGRMASVQFLPTVDWLESTSFLAWPVGIFSLCLGIAFPLAVYDFRKRKLLPPEKNKSRGRWWLLSQVLALGLLMLCCGHFARTTSIPFVYTAFLGEPDILVFEVKSAQKGNSKYCRRPIQLKGLPFFWSEFCNASSSFRNTLYPGSKVQIHGRATSLGIFADSATRLK